MFPKMGENAWLSIGFAVVLGLMALQTIISLRQMEQQRLQLKSVIEVQLARLDQVGRMHAAGRERILLLQRMFLTGDPFEREAIRDEFSRQAERFIQSRQALLAMPLSDEERSLLDRQGRLSQDFHAIQLQVLELLDQGALEEAKQRLNGQLLPIQYSVLATLTALYELQQRNTRMISVQTDRLQQKARQLLLTVAALVLIVGVVVAYLVFRRIRAAAAERERLATYDLLTGLPNRLLIYNLIEKAIARAQRRGLKLGVMFIDLDRFKQVNDTLGHRAGDKLLVEIAKRLGECVRDIDTVGRLAGDEFVVLMEDVHSQDEVRVVAERIRQAVRTPVSVDAQTVEVGASIGIALYPEHGSDREELLRQADAAMYAVKEGGRDGYCIPAADPGR